MKNYHEVPNISVDKALEAVQHAVSIGAELGVKVSVSVVDKSMNLIAIAKADGPTPHSTDTSRKKANTASSTSKATGWMSSDIAITLPMGSNNRLTNVNGGSPLIFDGKVVGGIGVAGGTVDQDQEVVSKVIEKIGSELPK